MVAVWLLTLHTQKMQRGVKEQGKGPGGWWAVGAPPCGQPAAGPSVSILTGGVVKVKELDWLKDGFCTDPEAPFSWSEGDIADLYDHTTVLFAAEGERALHGHRVPVLTWGVEHLTPPLCPASPALSLPQCSTMMTSRTRCSPRSPASPTG